MSDDTDTRADPTADTEAAAAGGPEHPLQRAHRFFQKATPVIREVNEAIDGGALEQVRDTVIERATNLVQRVDTAVANATALEGDVIERIVDEPEPEPEPSSEPDPAIVSPRPSTAPARSTAPRWFAIGVIVAAATYGALKLQRRTS